MSDHEKISKLIEAYDLIERCYQAIQELLKEKVEIETLTYAQIDISDVIKDIADICDKDEEWIYIVLADRDSSIADRATRIISNE